MPKASMASLSPDGRADWVELSAWGTDDVGRAIQVNLHIVNGLIHELEVWAGWDGSDPVSSFPHAETLRVDRR